MMSGMVFIENSNSLSVGAQKLQFLKSSFVCHTTCCCWCLSVFLCSFQRELKWKKQEGIRTMRGWDNIWVRAYFTPRRWRSGAFPNFARLLTPRGAQVTAVRQIGMWCYSLHNLCIFSTFFHPIHPKFKICSLRLVALEGILKYWSMRIEEL